MDKCFRCGLELLPTGECINCPSNKEIKRKIVVIERDSRNPSRVFQTTAEELVDKQELGSMISVSKRRNPNKISLLFRRNKFNELMDICYYKGNDFASIFISGGSHNSRFMLTVNDMLVLENMLHKLRKYILKEVKKDGEGKVQILSA